MSLARRAGLTLAEMTVALLTTGIILTALTAVLVTITRAGAQAVDGAETLDAFSVVAALLPIEARALMMADVRALARDSFALRAFRGTAIVCGRRNDGPLVRLVALRGPDPGKDSLLVVTADPERTVSILVASPAAPACPLGPGESLYQLVTTPDVLRAGDVALVFEPGVYHFATSAFRYRPPFGTRQPLTAEMVRTDSSAFAWLTRPRGPVQEPIALLVQIVARSRTPAGTGRRRAASVFLLQLQAAFDTGAPP